MNSFLPFAVVVLLTPAVRACDPGTSAPSTPAPAEPTEVFPEVELACDARADDAVIVTSATIDADLLTLDVEYSGGCADHDFGTCWDGSWIKTLPMQVYVDLSHDANGDMCRAMISETITFDLAPIADETLFAYPNTDGLWVRIGGKQIWYAF